MTRPSSKTLAAVSAALCASLALAAAPQEHGHPHHHQFAKDVDAFHAVLAPVWHSSPGLGRLQMACTKSGDMQKLVREIRSTDAKRLDEAVARLHANCTGNAAEVDKSLVEVHEAFHRLIEAKPAAAR